jgi:hypothetical protein
VLQPLRQLHRCGGRRDVFDVVEIPAWSYISSTMFAASEIKAFASLRFWSFVIFRPPLEKIYGDR